MTLALIIPASTPAVSVAEAKLHLRADPDVTDEDALIAAMVAAATQQAEHELQRAVMRQTWERRLDAWPAAEIRLGKPPVSSVLSITYIDPAGDERPVAPAAYELDTAVDGGSGWVRLVPGYSWPAVQDVANAIRVQFRVGVESPSEVPQSIRAWILLQVGALYRNREAFSAGVTVQELPGRFADMLLDPWRYYGGWAG